MFLYSQRAADFNPRAISLFNPSLIHFGSYLPYGRCVLELMQFVTKDFWEKSECSFASTTDGADQEIYEVSFSREF